MSEKLSKEIFNLNIDKEDSSFNPMTKKLLNFETLEKQLDLSFQSINRFYKKIDNYTIKPDLNPGFLYEKYIKDFPQNPSEFESILTQFEEDVFPNLCLWQHPGFFAYYQAPTSHQAITLEMICTAMHSPNFNWNVSPAAHELEWVVMDWMVKMLDIGEKFTFAKGGCGGCTISTTEGNFLSVNHAKYKKIKELNLSKTDSRRLKFVGYYPLTNKDWAEKALTLKDINFRRCLNVYFNRDTQNYNIDPKELVEAIKSDIKEGLVPFWFGGQIGSTNCGSTDQIDIIGPILRENNIFYHIDAAHAGLFLMLPEQRLTGMEYVNSICVNMVKSGLGVNPAALMFNDDKQTLTLSTGAIDGEIYRREQEGIKINYNDFSVGFGRRMVGIKLYGMIKQIGYSGYQEYLRNVLERGNYFLSLIKKNPRFELFVKPSFGLITFRIKPLRGDSLEMYNMINTKFQELMNKNTEDGFISSTSLNGIKFMRFVSSNANSEVKHVDKLWEKIEKCLEKLDTI